MKLTESELDTLLSLIEDWNLDLCCMDALDSEQEKVQGVRDKLTIMRERQRDINFSKNGDWT